MPKGIREPYQELEGGKGFGGMGGGGGGGGSRRLTFDERMAENAKNAGDMKKNMAGLATAMAGPVLGTVGSIVGGKVLADKRENERKEKAEREAAAELKRESRGMKKGGVTRADGCITKGHTRGKMV
jgi:hypothetical protein